MVAARTGISVERKAIRKIQYEMGYHAITAE
jgi:hypothetical protein